MKSNRKHKQAIFTPTRREMQQSRRMKGRGEGRVEGRVSRDRGNHDSVQKSANITTHSLEGFD